MFQHIHRMAGFVTTFSPCFAACVRRTRSWAALSASLCSATSPSSPPTPTFTFLHPKGTRLSTTSVSSKVMWSSLCRSSPPVRCSCGRHPRLRSRYVRSRITDDDHSPSPRTTGRSVHLRRPGGDDVHGGRPQHVLDDCSVQLCHRGLRGLRVPHPHQQRSRAVPHGAVLLGHARLRIRPPPQQVLRAGFPVRAAPLVVVRADA